MNYFLLFMMGSSLMSFLMQWGSQPHLKLKYCFQRSKCMTCEQSLATIDLIPIISFVLLKGRCRYCRQPIPRKLVIGEILGGLLILYPLFIPIYLSLTSFYSIALILLVLAIIDIDKQLIPHRFMFLLFILFCLLHHSVYLDRTHLLIFIIFLLIGCIPQRWIGLGDIKLLLLSICFFPLSFLFFFFELLFPIGCTLLPAFYYFNWIKNGRVPLVPAMMVTFVVISSTYPLLIVFFNRLIV